MLGPVGALSVSLGVGIIPLGVYFGSAGWSHYFGPTQKTKLIGTGIIAGSVIVGGGLIYLGVKLFNKGTNSEKITSKQKQLNNIKKFEGY